MARWVFAMTCDRYPKYEVKPLATGGWYVVLIRKDGEIEELYGFSSEAEAQAWVSRRLALQA